MKLLTKFQTFITVALTASATSIAVDSLTDIPDVSFMAILDAGSDDEECVLVTAIATATKTLTITRGQRGSSGVAHGKNTLLYHSEIEGGDIASNEVFAAAGHVIHLENVFTLATAGALKQLQIELVYQPVADSGYGTPIPIVGKVSLGEGAEFTGGQGAMYGVQGQLNFMDTAVVNQSSSVFAALRGVISHAGTPVFTDFAVIAGLYVDNLCTIDMKDIADTYGSALASLQNHGGWLDAGILIRGGNKITNAFMFNTMGGDCIQTGERSGNVKNIKIRIDADTWYLNVYDT